MFISPGANCDDTTLEDIFFIGYQCKLTHSGYQQKLTCVGVNFKSLGWE